MTAEETMGETIEETMVEAENMMKTSVQSSLL